MTTNFRFNNGGTQTDFDDAFIRKDLFASGGLFTWGDNNSGKLGNNNIAVNFIESPIQTISSGVNWKETAVSAASAAGIKTDGTLWLWGINSSGGLGTNNTTARSSPVQTISGGTNWKQVSVNTFWSAAIKTDGSLWLWGQNYQGQLGNNTTTARSSPVQTISAGNNWKQVSAGDDFCAAIKTDGTLWTWGQGSSGQLGDNTAAFKSSPVQTISATTNWKQVSCGEFHTSAVKTDGTLWTWGRNHRGQLGNNDTTNRSSPVQTISTGTNWKLVSCGYYHTAAIKTDGTLWAWGLNDFGQLGNNDITNRSSPVQTISAGTNWKQVSAGNINTICTKTDGTLWLWGANDRGQLGDLTTIHKSSPVQTVSGGTNWKQVASGTSTTAVINYYA
jgi:alpha-tubulin suppressor-like RCC1 family protein